MKNSKKSDLNLLKAQLRQYACNEAPYNESYASDIDTPLRWWKTCGDGTKNNSGALSTLAIKMFSLRPHAASCERIWSCCGRFLGDRRTRLTTTHLESMVKINSFLVSNAKQELQYYGVDLTEEELSSIFQDAALVAETPEDNFENLTDLDTSNPDLELEDQELNLESVMNLSNLGFGNRDGNSDTEESTTDDSENKEDEFNEDEFGAEFVQSLEEIGDSNV
jgi:hypothetical protein